MNSLPGRLTKSHIKLARERGDNYITYKRKTYPLTELEDVAGISRAKPKPKAIKNIYSDRVDNSDGEVSEFSSNPRKE